LPKKKGDNPDPKKGSRFTDPVTDSMRMMGRAFHKLEQLDGDDKKLVLAWINKRFIKGNKDLNITT
jgi:hypothetical protein